MNASFPALASQTSGAPATQLSGRSPAQLHASAVVTAE